MFEQGFYSSSELAARLGVKLSHIRQMARRGELPPCVKFGGLRRWSVDAINSWLAQAQTKEAMA